MNKRINIDIYYKWPFRLQSPLYLLAKIGLFTGIVALACNTFPLEGSVFSKISKILILVLSAYGIEFYYKFANPIMLQVRENKPD